MTLVNTFSMMERHNPAMMSSGDFPLRCSVTMLLFMNTVQRLPSSAGRAERNAASAMPSTGMRSVEAKFSKNEPQPDEQASFTTMSVMTRAVDPDGLHVLPADVEDERHVGDVFHGCLRVRHRLDHVVVGMQRFGEEQLAVTGGAHRCARRARCPGRGKASRISTSARRAISSGSPSLEA